MNTDGLKTGVTAKLPGDYKRQTDDAARPKCILALDPAKLTGWAYWDGKPAGHGTWDLSMEGPENRCSRLLMFVKTLALHARIDMIAYEDATFGSHNPHVQSMHNELRGVIKLAASDLHVSAVAYQIGTIKKFATGNGRASKPQMIAAAKTLLGIETMDDNIADALFILELAKQDGGKSAAKKHKPRGRKRPGQKKLF